LPQHAGSSFVWRLAKNNPHLQFRACGVNGMPSESMAARLPKLLCRYPNPAAVLIMAGSNDCLEQQCWSLHWVYRLGFWISRPATQDAFVDNMARMVQTVERTCPKAKVAQQEFDLIIAVD
jgi:lysophospholipase L1-like esterase